MEGATKDITQTINKNVYTYKQKLIASNLSNELNTVVPSEELAQKLSGNITKALSSLNIDSVQSSVKNKQYRWLCSNYDSIFNCSCFMGWSYAYEFKS